MKTILVVQGASHVDEIPGLDELADEAEIRFAANTDELRSALPGAEVLLVWELAGSDLSKAWDCATDLRWLHRGGAGVDAVLFPALAASDVQMTNARGLFDRAMAEWVLGSILVFAKQFRQSLELQAACEWRHRLTETLGGKRVLLVGAGSISREIGRLLVAVGMEIEAVGRSARDDDDFGHVFGIDELHDRLPHADYVVLITPLTAQTRGLFGAAEFAGMAPHARFINLGRGPLVVEEDLLAALHDGTIAGAALDVFVEEPLAQDSPFWHAPNCLVSPHMSGDFIEFETALVDQFKSNWKRYRSGQELQNIVDKALGYIPGSSN